MCNLFWIKPLAICSRRVSQPSFIDSGAQELVPPFLDSGSISKRHHSLVVALAFWNWRCLPKDRRRIPGTWAESTKRVISGWCVSGLKAETFVGLLDLSGEKQMQTFFWHSNQPHRMRCNVFYCKGGERSWQAKM